MFKFLCVLYSKYGSRFYKNNEETPPAGNESSVSVEPRLISVVLFIKKVSSRSSFHRLFWLASFYSTSPLSSSFPFLVFTPDQARPHKKKKTTTQFVKTVCTSMTTEKKLKSIQTKQKNLFIHTPQVQRRANLLFDVDLNFSNKGVLVDLHSSFRNWKSIMTDAWNFDEQVNPNACVSMYWNPSWFYRPTLNYCNTYVLSLLWIWIVILCFPMI